MQVQCAINAETWIMGPSGPMHSPEGTLAIIPIVLKNIVSKDVKDVILPVKLKKLNVK